MYYLGFLIQVINCLPNPINPNLITIANSDPDIITIPLCNETTGCPFYRNLSGKILPRYFLKLCCKIVFSRNTIFKNKSYNYSRQSNYRSQLILRQN